MEYKGPVPTIGDNRYNNWYHKPALDILRVEYYKQFGRDLSISLKDDNNEMFDPNISESSYNYFLRGTISSTVMLPLGGRVPYLRTFLNWKLEAKMLENPEFSKYLDYMRNFIIQTIEKNFNFVYSYASLRDYYLAYIPSGNNKSKFFKRFNG